MERKIILNYVIVTTIICPMYIVIILEIIWVAALDWIEQLLEKAKKIIFSIKL